MSVTNREAANLVNMAVKAGRVLTVRCPNGDTVTAGHLRVIRWGRSRFADPSGRDIGVIGSVGATVVAHCGRGYAAAAAAT